MDRLGLRDDTSVVFTSDNGADPPTLHKPNLFHCGHDGRRDSGAAANYRATTRTAAATAVIAVLAINLYGPRPCQYDWPLAYRCRR